MAKNSEFTNEQLELFSKYEKAGKSVEEINFIKEQVLLSKTSELWVCDEFTNEWYRLQRESKRNYSL
jgi:hypothetical protein